MTFPRRHVGRLLILASALTAPLFVSHPAEAGTLTVELDRTEGAVGDSFQMTLTIQGVRDSDPELPAVPGLVITQQGVSESSSVVNGQRTSSLQVSFAVSPQQAGTFEIPSFKAVLDGKPEASLPLTLRVHPAGTAPSAPQAAAPNNAQGGAPPAGKPAGKQTAAGGDTGGVFIERECDNTTPYAGEQVICAVRIYHRGNLNGGQRVINSSPDVRRFVVEGEKRYQRLVNGQRYAVIQLTEIVVPTKAGTVEVPAFAIDAKILTYSHRASPLDKFFDHFGGGVFNFDMNFTEEKDVTVKSEPTTLTVKPLPTDGRPAAFAGLVGDFALTAQTSRPTVAAGDTVTITASVTGRGLSDMLPAPTLKDGLGRVYADKPEYKEQMSAEQGIHSTRTFKLALVPLKPGALDLGVIEVPAFNPKLGTYVTLTAPLGQLIVDPGKAEEKALVVGQATGTGTNKESVAQLGSDLVDLDRHGDLTASGVLTKADVVPLAGVAGVPLSLALVCFGLVRRRGRDPELLRRAQARRHFDAALAAATAAATRGEGDEAVTLGCRALRTYLGDKLTVTGSALAAREAGELLVRLGLAPEAAASGRELLARLDGLAYAAGAVTPVAARAELAALQALVDQVEKVVTT